MNINHLKYLKEFLSEYNSFQNTCDTLYKAIHDEHELFACQFIAINSAYELLKSGDKNDVR